MSLFSLQNRLIAFVVLGLALWGCGGDDKKSGTDGGAGDVDSGQEGDGGDSDDGGDHGGPGPILGGFMFGRAFLIVTNAAPNGGGMMQPVAISHSLYFEGVLVDGVASQVERLAQWVEQAPNPNPKNGEHMVYIRRAEETTPNSDIYKASDSYVCWAQKHSGAYGLTVGSLFEGEPFVSNGGCAWTLEDVEGMDEGYFRIRTGLEVESNYLSKYPTTVPDGGTLGIGAVKSTAPVFHFVGANMLEGMALPE